MIFKENGASVGRPSTVAILAQGDVAVDELEGVLEKTAAFLKRRSREQREV